MKWAVTRALRELLQAESLFRLRVDLTGQLVYHLIENGGRCAGGATPCARTQASAFGLRSGREEANVFAQRAPRCAGRTAIDSGGHHAVVELAVASSVTVLDRAPQFIVVQVGFVGHGDSPRI